jgi:NADPH-dependent 2,4-dienoyl-CoA reductase/sulfur reductase-like enzyme
MDDALAMQKQLGQDDEGRAVIVGGGYIGMEMADALTRRGMAVTVLEFLDSLLTTVDPEFGRRVRGELEAHGVEVQTGMQVKRIVRSGERLDVLGSDGHSADASVVLVAVGTKPQAKLALSAGIETGVKGAIKVDRFMRTNVPNIYAAGDCVETWHRLLQQPSYLPLGTTAHKQGRVAGENAVGGHREFQGTLGTQVVQIFDLVVARTGLRDSEASAAGFAALTLEQEAWDHKAYYPGAEKVHVRLTGDRRSRRLLGAQVVGHRQSQIPRIVDCVATALHNGMLVDDLNDLDLSYTPPLGSPWDPIQVSAQSWMAALRREER